MTHANDQKFEALLRMADQPLPTSADAPGQIAARVRQRHQWQNECRWSIVGFATVAIAALLSWRWANVTPDTRLARQNKTIPALVERPSNTQFQKAREALDREAYLLAALENAERREKLTAELRTIKQRQAALDTSDTFDRSAAAVLLSAKALARQPGGAAHAHEGFALVSKYFPDTIWAAEAQKYLAKNP